MSMAARVNFSSLGRSPWLGASMAGHGEPAFGGEPGRAGGDGGSLIVLTAAVAHQDQGTRAGLVLRRPQDTGDVIDANDCSVTPSSDVVAMGMKGIA
jgi:hypothetical protein